MGSYAEKNVNYRLPEVEIADKILGIVLRVKSKVKIIKSVVLDLR